MPGLWSCFNPQEPIQSSGEQGKGGSLPGLRSADQRNRHGIMNIEPATYIWMELRFKTRGRNGGKKGKTRSDSEWG